ncbi:MAG TPA: hypothetical protein VJP40_00550, partial [bacterium]|nr:hypothetical protein [bacterium]
AYVVASYIIFHHRWTGDVEVSSVLLLGLTIGLALLMVSNVPYRNFKKINFKRKESFFALVLLACILFVVASAPSEMIFFIALAYVASGLVEEAFRISRRDRGESELLLGGTPNDTTSMPQDNLRLITNHKDK